MAGYVSIETIVPCRDVETLHEIVQRYLQTLVVLGIGEPTLFSWVRICGGRIWGNKLKLNGLTCEKKQAESRLRSR
jgi:hypothetical protein